MNKPYYKPQPAQQKFFLKSMAHWQKQEKERFKSKNEEEIKKRI